MFVKNQFCNILAKFDEHIRESYKKSKDILEAHQWPPIQSRNFVDLLLFRHSGKVYTDIIRKLAKYMQGHSDVPLAQTLTTKDIPDIFEDRSNLILIDGSPGIGKTFLSKEIAYRWACKNLLLNEKLVLLVFLRNPDILKIQSIRDLIHFFYEFDPEQAEYSAECAKWISDSNGKNITIILDGYDEISDKSSFFDKFLGRRILPQCTIVVTSRPIASARLRDNANVTLEILGFTEDGKEKFIDGELEGCEDKLSKLKSKLKDNSKLNHLCSIPFLITVLVNLSKAYDILPTSQHDLYEKFIVYTISHFLQEKFSTIDDIAKKYKNHFSDLCHFAFVELSNDRIVFSRKDIENQFSNFADAPDSLSGFGLLRSAKYFSVKENNDCTSYNFIHLSIQEYLAAYYISILSPTQQVNMLKNYFFKTRYLNMWIMYGGLCKETSTFERFLSGKGSSPWHKFIPSRGVVRSKLQQFYLFQVSTELNSTNIHDLISTTFKKKCLDFSMHKFSAKDIDMLAFLLEKATVTYWNELNLSRCYIGSDGCCQLYDAVKKFGFEIKFKIIDISFNDLKLKLDVIKKF